ncbi:MAG: hypothetical protein ACXWT3_10145 [Methylococcaceae bacterium]
MKTIFIENDLKSFEDFHDKQWFSDVFKLVDDSDIVDEVDEFSAHWWGASRAFLLPWLLVDGVYESINAIVPITDKSKQDYWGEYLKIMAFKGSLWKIAEAAYTSIYYAYENLIVNLLNKNRTESIRVTDKRFCAELNNELGSLLTNKIWNESFVVISREIRNCIVHCGGKASTKLLTMKPLPQIENMDILISASDVRTFYSELKPRVIFLLEHHCKKM